MTDRTDLSESGMVSRSRQFQEPHRAATDPDLDLRATFGDALLPGVHGLLGAHVLGGDPLIPLLSDFVLPGFRRRIPRAVDRSYAGFDYGMLLNNQIGDCVIAAEYHAVMHMRKVSGGDVPSDSDALNRCVGGTYSDITGWVPDDPSTDRGTDPASAWSYWRDTGLLLPDSSRDQIVGVTQILPHDGANMRRGIYELDCVGMSLAMPLAWQETGDTWDIGGDPQVDPAWQPGGWGGHEVLGVSFDRRKIAIVTWGGIKFITWQAWGTYGMLGLAHLNRDQLSKQGMSETGLSWVDLTHEFALV